MELSNGFVILMGLGTVFFGLICIVLICVVMGWIFEGSAEAEKQKAQPAIRPPVMAAPTTIENRQELLSVVSAALAEELGTDVSAIRITNLKKL